MCQSPHMRWQHCQPPRSGARSAAIVVLVSRAMDTVCAGFGQHSNLATLRAGETGSWIRGHNAKFLNCLSRNGDEWSRLRFAGRRNVAVRALKVARGIPAIDVERRLIGKRASHLAAVYVIALGTSRADTGLQHKEGRDAALLGRQMIKQIAADDGTDARVIGLQ